MITTLCKVYRDVRDVIRDIILTLRDVIRSTDPYLNPKKVPYN